MVVERELSSVCCFPWHSGLCFLFSVFPPNKFNYFNFNLFSY